MGNVYSKQLGAFRSDTADTITYSPTSPNVVWVIRAIQAFNYWPLFAPKALSLAGVDVLVQTGAGPGFGENTIFSLRAPTATQLTPFYWTGWCVCVPSAGFIVTSRDDYWNVTVSGHELTLP